MRKFLVVGLLFCLAFTVTSAQQNPPSRQDRENFRQAMMRNPPTKRGCFIAHYPSKTWVDDNAHCTPTPSPYPNPIARGVRRLNAVGNGDDYFIQETGHINSATGSFDSISGIASNESEAGYEFGITNMLHYNVYSLQLKTNVFPTPSCGGQSGCSGWEQFLFSQSQCNGACIFIEYWLLGHGAPCPGGWNYYSDPVSATASGCYLNTAFASVSTQPLTDLGELKLSGVISGGLDVVMLTTANGDVQASASDSLLILAQGWTGSEFNLVGDCCATGAYFIPSNTSLTVRLSALNGTTNAPSYGYPYSFNGATAEFNNLTLGGTPTVVGGTDPAIIFKESGGGNDIPAGAIGDPHLTTIGSLHYDFQGIGDFTLIIDKPEFEIQARQSPWAGGNVSVNTGLGVQMGNRKVALCMDHLYVDGNPRSIDDGKTLILDIGDSISRQNNVFTITQHTGDRIQAKIMNGYMDVYLNVAGVHPRNVMGLLRNDIEIHSLVMRDGTNLRQPIQWNTWLKYADSWRVPESDSLMGSCPNVRPGFASTRMISENLPAAERTHASEVCEKAGVPHGPLFNDCVLDVGVTKMDSAADAFVHHQPIKTVIFPLPPQAH